MILLMKKTKKNIVMRIEMFVNTTEGGFLGVISPYPTVLTVWRDQYMA
jgi:hypothetical protein